VEDVDALLLSGAQGARFLLGFCKGLLVKLVTACLGAYHAELSKVPWDLSSALSSPLGFYPLVFEVLGDISVERGRVVAVAE
jgi:hypothetical protein